MTFNVGDRLRSLRLAHDMTLEDVAKRLGLAKQTLYKYETGIITNIPLENIEEMAKIYGTTPAYIVGWQPLDVDDIPEPTNNPDRDWVYKKLPDMTDEQVKRMRKLYEMIDDELQKE